MTYEILAFLAAAMNAGRSWVSQRTDVFGSGRRKQTSAFPCADVSVVANAPLTVVVIATAATANTTMSLFPAAETAPYAVGELRVPPSDARRLKEELRIAFVVSPKEPFLVAGQRKVGETTIRNPRAVTENFTILVADIRCGLVMDRAGTILGAYPTN